MNPNPSEQPLKVDPVEIPKDPEMVIGSPESVQDPLNVENPLG